MDESTSRAPGWRRALAKAPRAILRVAWVLTGYLVCVLTLAGPTVLLPALHGIAWHLLAGLNLAVLLAFGVRYCPILVLGPLLVGAWLDPLPVDIRTLARWGVLLAAGAGVGAATLRHGLRTDPRLLTVRDVSGLVGVALLQPLPVAAAGMILLVRTGLVSWDMYPAGVVAWWIGQALGALTVAPALLVHGVPLAAALAARAGPFSVGTPRPVGATWRRPRPRELPRVLVEGLGQAASLALAVWVPFASGVAHEVRLLYLGFLPLLWIALRWGLAGASLAVLGLNLGVVAAVRSTSAPAVGLPDLQLLLLAFALTGLYLGAVTSARRRAEQARRVSRARFRAVFDRALDALVVLDARGRFREANPAASALFGLSRTALLGRELFDFVAPRQAREARRAWREVLERGEREGALQVRRADGALRDVEYAAKADIVPGRHLSILRDVTERRRLEADLRRSEKTEAIGRLAGGIAHDFNNRLAVILGYAEAMTKVLPEDDPLRHDAEEIRTAAERAAQLTRQLLAFSRRQAFEPVRLDLNALVHELEPTLQRLAGDRIELNLDLAEGLGPVRGDPAPLRQAVLNLALNARAAMPAGGRLTVETADAELGEAFARQYADAVPGAYVRLAVRDTGAGMSPEVRAHLFEPFFTTHEVGQGTGLGLATVHGIVRQHLGLVMVESEVGRGSTFALYLPRLDGTRSEALRRGATILLVDDDRGTRQGVGSLLARQGHTVLEAANGGEALFIAEWHEDAIDLLVVPADLSQLSGPDLALRLRTARPELRVLYLVDADAPPGDGSPTGVPLGAPWLRWPAAPDVLAARLHGVLAVPPPPS
jgi:PAS domain S-box-containing protein